MRSRLLLFPHPALLLALSAGSSGVLESVHVLVSLTCCGYPLERIPMSCARAPTCCLPSCAGLSYSCIPHLIAGSSGTNKLCHHQCSDRGAFVLLPHEHRATDSPVSTCLAQPHTCSCHKSTEHVLLPQEHRAQSNRQSSPHMLSAATHVLLVLDNERARLPFA